MGEVGRDKRGGSSKNLRSLSESLCSRREEDRGSRRSLGVMVQVGTVPMVVVRVQDVRVQLRAPAEVSRKSYA